jgi:pimeloyl-ACP methyl ester carboxylesterase
MTAAPRAVPGRIVPWLLGWNLATDRATAAPADLFVIGHDGVRLHLLDWGGPAGAPLLIMLHGVGGNAWSFGAVAPLLDVPYRLLGVDQRGGGDSDKPVTGYSAEDFALDVLAIHEQLGGGQPMVLVGHSRGGWQAAYIAARWPSLVSHLVLVDPARITFDSPGDADDFYGPVRAALGPFASRELALAFGRARDAQAIWNADRERTFLFGYSLQGDGSLIGKLPGRVLDELRAVRESTDITESLGNIRVPTLLLVATRSNDTRKAQKLAYSRAIAHARVEYVEGTHHIHIEQPLHVAQLIRELLA